MLVELAIGDAYGAGFEYVDPDFVFENNDLSQYFQHPRHGIRPGRYTDDTQMTIAIVELILENQDWTFENIAEKFAQVFKRDVREGYARRFFQFLRQVKNGRDFLKKIKPFSDKSGAAMRAGPIGMFPTEVEVLDKAEIQAKVTHNTESGIAAAQAAALMVNFFFYRQGKKKYLGQFLDKFIMGSWDKPFTGKVGSKGWMSVSAAVTVIIRNDSMSSLLKDCIAFTGDVDTVATIALAAACWSDEIAQDLPDILVYNLENGKYGRRYLEKLDSKLLRKFPRP